LCKFFCEFAALGSTRHPRPRSRGDDDDDDDDDDDASPLRQDDDAAARRSVFTHNILVRAARRSLLRSPLLSPRGARTGESKEP
jgi:hypothetical protein